MTTSDSSQPKTDRPATEPSDTPRSARQDRPIEVGSSAHSALEGPTVISGRPPVPASGSARPNLNEQLVGRRLDHFELEAFVGGGGMGAVYRALDKTLNRHVAVKLLSDREAADEDTVRRFRNEAQSAARLNHENIARVHFVGEDAGLHYIVFEFIEGTNIRDMVGDRGRLPLHDALNYTMQIADALDHSARRDVVHRDIKPSNVIITPSGVAKLVDMGLARLHQVEHSGGDLTASGMTLGTFDYISPEQARDPRSADVRSDIYSLGCTLYFMLTARPPFPEGTVLQKLLQHQGDAAPDPRQFNPDVPEEVCRLLEKMMAKDPLKRYQTPGQLLVELTAVVRAIAPDMLDPRRVGTIVPIVERTTWLERHLPWMAPAVALLAIVLALHFASSGTVDSLPTVGAPPSPVDEQAGTAADGADAPPPADSDRLVTPLREPVSPREEPLNPTEDTQPTGVAAADTKQAPSVPQDDRPTMEPANVAKRESEDGSDFATESPLRERLQAAARERAGLSIDKSDSGPSFADSGSINGEAHREVPSGGTRDAANDDDRANAAAAAVEPDEPMGHLIVSDTGEGPRHFRTLSAACASADHGDVIVLRYDGRREELPLEINNLDLTIRGDDGYQPVVLFRPEVEPVQYPRGMISVSGGSLTLLGVHLEMVLPRHAVVESRALLEARRAKLVRLERSTMTIRNAADDLTAFHKEVSFIDVQAPPGFDAMPRDNTDMDLEQPVTIELENCIARGEADFLRSSDLQPVELLWKNGLLVTTERFLVAGSGATAPRSNARIRLDVRHVTAVMRRGLCLLTNSIDAPYQLQTEIDWINGILVARPDAVLLEQRGVDDVSQFRDRVTWNEKRNMYQGFEIFRRIGGRDPEPTVSEKTWPRWSPHWPLGNESPTTIGWLREPSELVAVHEHDVDDYLLRSDSPLRRLADDGEDLGFDSRSLPAAPAAGPADATRSPFEAVPP